MQRLGQYLKIGQAAESLGIAQNTLRNWADEGRYRRATWRIGAAEAQA